MYVKYFEGKQTKCCNPFFTHNVSTGKGNRRKQNKQPQGHHLIDIEVAKHLLIKSFKVIPGQKVCNKSWERIKSLIEKDSTEESSSANSQLNDSDFFVEDESSTLDSTLIPCGV